MKYLFKSMYSIIVESHTLTDSRLLNMNH